MNTLVRAEMRSPQRRNLRQHRHRSRSLRSVSLLVIQLYDLALPYLFRRHALQMFARAALLHCRCSKRSMIRVESVCCGAKLNIHQIPSAQMVHYIAEALFEYNERLA